MVTLVIVGLLGLVGWAISNAAEKHNERERLRNEQETARQKAEAKWGPRLKNGMKSLEERNQDIIQTHIDMLSPSYYRSHYIDDAVSICVQCIADIEGRTSFGPRYTYLSKWSQTATQEFKSLADSLLARFRARLDELQRLEQDRVLIETETRFEYLRDKHIQLIDRFYEVTERKVSLRDDYGEERWDALDREVSRVVLKIAEKEGVQGIRDWSKDEFMIPQEYKRLSAFLKETFREVHGRKGTEPTQFVDYSTMTGEEFEIHLMNLLKRLGYTDICGTPTTGDQGADVLAKKEGRKIVIQAKKYSGSVGNDAVQEVLGALHFYCGDEAWVVTNSAFTQSAKELSQRTGIRLIDGHELARLIQSK